MRRLLLVVTAMAVALSAPVVVHAKRSGGGGSSYSIPSYRYSSPEPGTGSNSSSHGVRGHIKRDGTYVAPYRRTDSNRKFEDNYSTKPNANPWTGETGTRVTPPRR